MLKVLIALRNAGIRERLAGALRLDGIEIRQADNAADVLSALVRDPAEVVVLDLDLCEVPAEAIDTIHKVAPDARLVVCAGASSARDAAVVEKGVFFYAVGIDADQLASTIRAGLRRKEKARP